jgi:hypothetical protein
VLNCFVCRVLVALGCFGLVGCRRRRVAFFGNDALICGKDIVAFHHGRVLLQVRFSRVVKSLKALNIGRRGAEKTCINVWILNNNRNEILRVIVVATPTTVHNDWAKLTCVLCAGTILARVLRVASSPSSSTCHTNAIEVS